MASMATSSACAVYGAADRTGRSYEGRDLPGHVSFPSEVPGQMVCRPSLQRLSGSNPGVTGDVTAGDLIPDTAVSTGARRDRQSRCRCRHLRRASSSNAGDRDNLLAHPAVSSGGALQRRPGVDDDRRDGLMPRGSRRHCPSVRLGLTGGPPVLPVGLDHCAQPSWAVVNCSTAWANAVGSKTKARCRCPGRPWCSAFGSSSATSSGVAKIEVSVFSP